MANPVFRDMGTTIFETMSRLAAEAGAVNLGQGFPEGLEAAEVVEAAAEAVRAGPHQYPSMLGLPDLRKAVAETSRRFWGLEVDWEREVLVTSGATEALADCFFGLLGNGDEVITFQPAYDSYAPIIRRSGAVPIQLRLEPPAWELPRQQLIDAISPRTRAIVINTPMNPTGKVFTREELEFIAELVARHNLIAICDEVYEHLTFDGVEHLPLMALPGMRGRCLRIGSAGKTFSLTGWKVGYVTGDAELLAPVTRAHQYITFTTPPHLQTAVAFGLRLPDSYYEGLKNTLQVRRDELTGALRAAGFTVLDCAGTYFLCIDISALDAAGDDFALCKRLVAEAGVAAVPVSSFYADGDMRTLIRLCFAKQPDVLKEGAARLTAWLQARG